MSEANKLTTNQQPNILPNQPLIYDLIIIGAGPAGLTASIYASRYKLSNLVIGKQLGGELGLAHKVCNIPGFIDISGLDLAEKWKEQVESLGAKVLLKEVEKIEIANGSLKSTDGRAEVGSLSSLRSLAKNSLSLQSHANKVNQQPSSSRDALKPKTEEFLLAPRELSFKIIVSDKEIYQAKSLIVATGSERRRLNIPGEKEYLGRGVSYCTTCFPPGEEVVANNSLKRIEELGIANKVLTKDGSYQNINQIIARDYEGELIEIKTAYFTEAVKLTTNHPVLCSKIKRDYYRRKIILAKPEWKEAGDLNKEDCVLYPVVKKVEDIKIIKVSKILGVETRNGMAVLDQETHSSCRISDKIKIDEKFLRLAGYFLAEGAITYHGVNFYFNKKEKIYINDVKGLIQEVFGLEPFFKIEGSVGRICIFSKLISDLFESLFGKYAPYKKIPHWMLFLPLAKQKELIKGLYRGDGCLREEDFCVVTSSRILAYQLRDILLRFSVIASIQRRKKAKLNQNIGKIGRRKIRFKHDKYHVVIGGASLENMSKLLGIRHPLLDKRTRFSKFALIKKDHLYLPIREVRKEDYNGRVFNLAVAKNNTYVAKNFIVHNCDAAFFKNKTAAVIGGSDVAVTSAIHLADYCQKVYLIYRGESLKAEPVWLEEWKKIEAKGKGETIYNTNLKRILGYDDIKILGEEERKNLNIPVSQYPNIKVDKVGAVELDNLYKESKYLAVDGVFISIGGVPGTTLVQQLGIKLDDSGHVVVNDEMETNISGLFCAGDMTDKSKVLKQAVTAMAQGAIAASSIYKYLKNQSAPQIRGV